MAAKCATEVTILDQTDATAVCCWYHMSSSPTLPDAPTTTDASATPSGWSKSEPTISGEEDAAKYVYACWQTVWGDGTCDWGEVSMSASFEAAKTAWNLAHNTSQELANLSVGGTNLIVHDTTIYGRLDGDGGVYTASNGAYHRYTERIPVEGGATYILSWFHKVTEYATSFLYVSWFDAEGGHLSRTTLVNIHNVEPSSRKLVAPATASYAVVSMPLYLAEICAAQLEKGTVPSDLSLSVRDAMSQPNILRGTNQPNVLRGFNDTSAGTWANGLWYISSGSAVSGDATMIEVDGCDDARQRYGFRVSSTSGNKDITQRIIPWKATVVYRITGLVRLTHIEPTQQTSATLQFRIWGDSSALKTYTQVVTSEEWVPFSYAFSLTADQIAIAPKPLLGINGKGSLDFCAIYIHEGFIDRRLSLDEEYLPWQPAMEDYASYGSTNNAIAETSANAVKRTQRIYYRTQSTTAPTSEFMPTAWVTETGDKWAADAATLSNWTTKVAPISDGTTKYLRLYTCEQREMGDGTLLYTNVLLDDSTTVIDGGNIITGSVAANRIDAASGTFSTANIPVLTADKIDTSTISIGSLADGDAIARYNLIQTPDYFTSVTDVGDGWLHVDYVNNSSNIANHYWGVRHCDLVIPGKTYTIMLEFRNWECSTEPTGNYMYIQQMNGHQFWGGNGVRCDGKEEERPGYATYIHYEDVADGSMCAHIVKVADTEHNPTSTGNLFRYRMYTPPKSTNSFDIRWSLYDGDYSGPYRPYIDADTAKTATNYIQADSTGIRIANANPATATTYQHQTATETEFVVGGTSMAEFGGSGARIGDSSAGHIAIDADSVDIADDDYVITSFSGTHTYTETGSELQYVREESESTITTGKQGDAYISLDSTITWNGDAVFEEMHSVTISAGASSVIPGVTNPAAIQLGGLYSNIHVVAPSISFADTATSDDGNPPPRIAMKTVISSLLGGYQLFSSSTAYTSNITGLSDLDAYNRLLIEYMDTTERRGSVTVDKPNGGTFVGIQFGCNTLGGNAASGLVMRVKTYTISDESTISVLTDSYSRPNYGRLSITPAKVITWTEANEIGIVKVLGFY